jgi:hypothetical protein
MSDCVNSPTYLTASGVVGTSGKACKIYGMHIIAAAGADGVCSLGNGTASSNTVYATETADANTGKSFTYPGGWFFPSGCYATISGSPTSVVIWYRQVKSV